MNKKKKQKPTPKKPVKKNLKKVDPKVIQLGKKVAQVQANVIVVQKASEVPPEKKKHYVNNKDLLTAILQYKKDARGAKREKLPPPRMPEYVGQSLMLIAENLSHKPNFV